ncbi:TPA: glycosyltransferase family 4 protein [Escherichia coli]|uniref:WfcD n=9 Tax=Escherichia coli TaxID=562 RepID=A6MF03_ECOLX|nr:glycosyltransferase family 4 protein [Escherichia coli]HCC7242597.1 glycosyltransferase family 4 protein [Escherichia coli O141:H32]ABI98978.1 WfcD [Escherichia coli]EES5002810.1 glycosyltransferase [Escherichia coli]EET7760955.1 glycosyltransferase [Escherichia coli]EEV6028866.1 glycosyltransferase [Escherichia coli]
MQPIKVLQFSKFYPPAVGGIEQVVYDIVQGCSKYPHIHNDVLCFNHDLGQPDHEITVENLRIMRMHTAKIVASTPLSFNIFKRFLKLRDEYDLVHFHVPNPIATFASFFVKKNKYIVHWHSDIVKQKKLLCLFKPFQNIMLRRAARIIVTSDKYGRESQQLKDYSEKLITIPIGISPIQKTINQELFQALKKEFPFKKIVFSLGRLAYYKGFEYLIKSARYLNDDCVILIGGAGELKDDLQALIQKYNLHDKVRLLGRIDDVDLSTYYIFSDVFCMPSIEKSEAFGVVQLEAMLYSLPIVSTKIPGSGVDWVNADGVSGITVEPKNEHAIAEAINKLLSDDSLRHSLGKNAHNRLLELFTVDRMSSQLSELYCHLILTQKAN